MPPKMSWVVPFNATATCASRAPGCADVVLESSLHVDVAAAAVPAHVSFRYADSPADVHPAWTNSFPSLRSVVVWQSRETGLLLLVALASEARRSPTSTLNASIPRPKYEYQNLVTALLFNIYYSFSVTSLVPRVLTCHKSRAATQGTKGAAHVRHFVDGAAAKAQRGGGPTIFHFH